MTLLPPFAAAPPRLLPLLAAGAGAAAILAAVVAEPPVATAARAALVALALAAAARLARGRGGAVPAEGAIGIAGHRALSRDAAVAILRIRGRALLVGYGPDGVRLLADLGADGEGPP